FGGPGALLQPGRPGGRPPDRVASVAGRRHPRGRAAARAAAGPARLAGGAAVVLGAEEHELVVRGDLPRAAGLRVRGPEVLAQRAALVLVVGADGLAVEAGGLLDHAL